MQNICSDNTSYLAKNAFESAEANQQFDFFEVLCGSRVKQVALPHFSLLPNLSAYTMLCIFPLSWDVELKVRCA